MALAAETGHEISVLGNDDPKAENEIICSCGWQSRALPEFVTSLVQRHAYLFAGLKP